MKNYSYILSNSSDGIGKLMRSLSTVLFFLLTVATANAQYVNIPVSGFNNDIVANGTGPGTPGSMPGVTYPLIGVDGNLPAAFSFIDNTFLWSPTSVSPSCFMPSTRLAPSMVSSGLTYQFQDYGTLAVNNNNALTIDNNSTTYSTSPFPNSATLTLSTPASYLSLHVLYESVVNVSPLTVDVTVTFTDATTQTINGNSCQNWFTNTNTAYTNISRAGNQGGAPASCPGGPYLFEMVLPLSSANFSKEVQSITFTIPTTFTTGVNSASVNYFHAMAVGGLIGCATPMSGNYTINNFAITGGTNFSSFADFAAALSCSGVSGPVVAEVDLGSGPYDEQVNFLQIPGASAINTITINGNARRLTKTLAGGTSYATMNLNGADYMIVNNLRIDALGAVGYGVHLMNRADNNTFSNCLINVQPNTTSANCIGVSMSASTTSYSFAGQNGSNNLFTGCTVNGGYFGFVFYGDGVSYLNNANNSIVNCTIQDYYFYGSYNYFQGGNTISRNIFQRPTRSSGTLTTGYGIMLTTGCQDVLIEKNRIRNMFGTNPATTNTVYAIYVSTTATPGFENKIYNNQVYDIFSNGNIFGVYMSGAQNVKVYHNTIALLHTGASGSSTTTYGIYGPSSGGSIANNIIYINRGGTASMYGLYYPNAVLLSNYNDVYLPALATHFYGYNGTNQLTFTNWKTANPTYDQQSANVDPLFTAPLTGDFTPTNNAINSIGKGFGVATDIIGAIRSPSFPDPGAYEFTPQGLDAAIQWVSPVTPVAVGTYTVTVLVANTMTIPITDLSLTYTNGVTPQTQIFTGLNIGSGGSQVLSFSVPFNLGGTVNLSATINLVNGVTDDASFNNTTTVNLCTSLSGSYTINSAVVTGGTNFQTFNALVTALNCGGILGPVTVDVVAGSGPYNEQVEFKQIAGTSAINTFTINGNGTTLSFNATLSAAPHTLSLNGTDWMTVNNLNVVGLGTTYAMVGHLWNQADNNTFLNCTFTAPANGTSSVQCPFSLSCSATSPTTTGGLAGNNLVLNGCTMNSGYYNTVLAGSSNASPSTGTQVINCVIKDWYLYGIYNLFTLSSKISGNLLERPLRTSVTSSYGIFLSSGVKDILVEKNKIRRAFDGAVTTTSSFYGIYNSSLDAAAGLENKFYNNVISDMKSAGLLVGFYAPSSSYSHYRFAHNTISFDETTAAGTTTVYGIYTLSNNNTEIRNNIISIRRGGSGVKTCLYYSPAPTVSNHNDLFILQGATNYVKFDGTTGLKSLAEWQAANPAMDQQSKSSNPSFIGAGNPAFDYTPSAGTINNICPNVGVNTDIAGSSRGATPDPGAYEFTPQPLDAVLGWVSPAAAPFTPGNNTITVAIINNGSSTITSASITYTDGVTPVTQVFSGLNIPLGGTQNVSFTTQYNLTGTATLTATLTLLNGVADADPSNNTVIQFMCVPLSGTYTINSAVVTGGTNFQTFTAAINNLASCGILGPVTFNVDAASGPYVEQIEIPVIGGSSAVNTITFNGNGRTMQFSAVTSYPTLRLNGVDWTVWNNMNFVALSTSQGFAGQISNQSDNNSFNNCTFTVSITATTSLVACFSLSALSTSPTGAGQNGSNNTFTGCTFTGGYYCVSVYGNTASESSPTNNNNKFLGCTMQDFYFYAFYHGYSTNTVVSGCVIERPTRLNATLTTGYGLYLFGYQTNAVLVEKNRIRNFFTQGPANTNSAYGIYVSSAGMLGNEQKIYNNVISNIGSNNGFMAGIYCFGAYTNLYHNTITFNYPVYTYTSTIYGVYVSASAPINIKNNIVSLSLIGGSGVKSCLYFFTPTGYITTCNYNDLFNNSTSGTNPIAYDGTINHLTLAAWQTAYPMYDQQSYSVDPSFVNPAANNFSPQAFNLDNTAEPIGFAQDVTGAPRSPVTPDIGAYEVSLPPTADFAPVSLVSPGTSGCYSSTQSIVVKIKNIGNYTHDFSAIPVTVTCNVTGTTTASLTGSPSGTLASQQTMEVTLTGSFDMSALGAYAFGISTSVAGDANTANNILPTVSRTRVVLASGTVSTNRDKLCDGRPTLLLTGKTGGNVQWKLSTAGASGPWTNTGTDDVTFTPAADLTQSTWYMADVSCLSTTLSTNVQSVLFNPNPTLLAKTGAARCGIGPVTLTGTADPLSDVNWYTSQNAAVPVFTGNNYTIAALDATATYYVSASFGGSVNRVGLPISPAYYSYTTGNYGIVFDAAKSFTLRSVDVYPAATTNGSQGTINIALQNSAGITLVQKTVTVTGYVAPLNASGKNTVDLGFQVPAGSNYRLTCTSMIGLNGMQYDCGLSGNCSTNFYTSPYNYNVPDVVTLKGGHLGSSTLYNYYVMYFYNWAVTTGCESPREPVVASYAAAPGITASASVPALCPGSTSQLSIVTSGNPAYTYNWTPGNFSGSSVDVAPTVLTNYTVTATDNTAGQYAGCQALAYVQVSTKPKVSVVATANPVDICSGQGSQLGVTASTTVSYAMTAATPQPIATPGSGVTILDKTNFPGNSGGLDDGYFSMALPFEFSFYGVTHNKINIGTNGYVSFINGYSGIPSNAAVILPHTGDINNAIYLAWKDWDISISGSIQYFTVGNAPHRTFVIKYVDVPPFVAAPPYSGNKFNGQIELYEDNGKIALFIAQTDAVNIKTLGIENPQGIGAYAPSARNGEAWAVVSPEQWEFNPIGGTLAYNWTPAANLDNATSTTPVASFIFATTVFTATVTDAAGGCIGSDKVTLATGDPLNAPINSTAASLCAGNSAILSVIPDGGCAPYTYQWSDGTSIIGIGGFISVTPSTTTNYTMTVTDGANTEKVTNFLMTVNPLPTVSATNGVVCGTGTASLTASGNAVSYSWSPASYLNTTTGTSVTSTPLATITYTVTGLSALGCPNTALAKVTKSFVTTVTPSATFTAVPVNGSTQLTAVGQVLGAGYAVSSTPYYTRNQTVVANAGPTGDEGNTNAALGFSFNFFGTSYTDVTIHTNGQILFGANRTEANSQYYPSTSHSTLPNVAQPNNWVGFWADMSPLAGQVKWGVVGSAPDRKFIARWENATWFTTGPAPLNYQIEINEGSNSIDVYLSGVTGGTSTPAHTRLVGLENPAGTLGTVAPGRTPANGFWNTFDEGWHFAMADTGITYAWSPATFLNNTALQSPTASGMTATTTYSVTATNADGCTGTNSILIEVGVPLVVTTATSVNNFCELLSTTLSSTPTGGCQPYTYSWSDGSTEVGTTKNKLIAPPSGINTYTLTVTDDCGATASSSVSVTVKPAPNVTATKSGDICGTVPVTLTGGGAVSYVWTPVTGLNNGTLATVNCNATATTTYTVTGTGANACSRPVPILVNVFPAVVANPTATPATVCANGTSQLQTNPATDNGYTVNSVAYSGRDLTPVSNPGPTGDEGNTDATLGFNFNFAGVNYNAVTIHTNGQILMGAGRTEANSQYYPNSSHTNVPNVAAPNNWVGFWADMSPLAGEVTWGVVGTSPTRKLIVRWTNATWFSAGPSPLTYQIELNETTNIIDVFLTTVSGGSFASSHDRLVALENATGTFGIAPPGRTPANGFWNATNEGWRFQQVIPTLVYNWTPATFLDDVSIANPTASNITSSQTYTATVTNTATGCSGNKTVTILTGVPLVATATRKFPTTCSGDDDSLFVAVTGGRAPYTYSWSDGTSAVGTAQKIKVNPLVTTSYDVTVTDACGIVTTSAPVSINVIALPVLSVTPPAGSICNGLPASISMTASGADTYAWSPVVGLDVASGATVVASPSATTTYTVLGVNTTTTCKNTITVTLGRTDYISSASLASPPQVCASQASQLSAIFTAKTNPAVLITEVTQFGAGASGATTPRPSYFAASDDDFIEISNLSDVPLTASGLTFELWSGTTLNRAYIIPAGAVIAGHKTLVLHIGTGTNSPVNNYYHTGGSNDPLTSSNGYGYLLKSGSSILDAVATTASTGIPYAWPAASGVTAANWNGTIPFVSTTCVGITRTAGYDSNLASDWTYAVNALRQTLGSYSNYFGSNSQPAFTYSWSPATYLDDATLENPLASGYTGGLQNYTVTATDPTSGCTSNASTSVDVLPLPTVALSSSVTPDVCAGTGTTLIFTFTGVGPWNYSYTDGFTTFALTSATSTASVNIVPPGVANDNVTYTPVSVSDTRCDGEASSLSGSVTVSLKSYSSISGITLTSNKPFNNICTGDNITLSLNNVTPTSLGYNAHWKWYTGSCNAGTPVAGSTDQLSITVNPSVNTNYFVRAEGYCNITSCLTVPVTVSTAPPSANPGLAYAPLVDYPGSTDSLVINAVPGATFYRWTTNGNATLLFDGQPAPYETSSPKVMVTFLSPTTQGQGVGSYHLSFIAGNACGRTNQNNVHIRGTVAAVGSVTGPLVACPGQTKTYVAAATVGAKSYQWSFASGNGSISGNGTATVNVTFTSLPAVLCVHGVTAFNSAGPDTCITITTVTDAPGAITGNAVPCRGGLETYSISGVTGALTYNWTSNIAGAVVTGNGLSATVQFPSGVFSGTVCVTANSGCGNSAPSCFPVVSGTTPPLGTITGTAFGVCNATSVNYQVPSTGATNYNWTVPAGATIFAGQGTNSILVDFDGTFINGSIDVFATNVCGTATGSFAVEGAPAPPAISGTALVCADQDEPYTASSPGGTTYSWTVNASEATIVTQSATGDQVIIHWETSGGTIWAVATNDCGSSLPGSYVVGADACRISGNATLVETLQALVFPNPSQGKLTLQYNSPQQTAFLMKITDLMGRTIQRESLQAFEGLNRHEINLGQVAKGIYMLSLENEVGEKVIIRLVIE